MPELNNRARHCLRVMLVAAVAVVLLASCSQGRLVESSTATPLPTGAPVPEQTSTSRPDGLSEAEARTLGSLERVDPYPLYTMRYDADYTRSVLPLTGEHRARPRGVSALPAWACSLFAALGDAQDPLYGRNFDWDLSPALLLFTNPSDGYASVSMVDIAYLGFSGDRAHAVLDLPPGGLVELLDAPFWPFDGMNEQGVVVGMAAVPPGGMQPDPDRGTIGSLGVIREILDNAGNVDEAVAIIESYNIDFRGGPDLHYLIADRSGRAALVEFYQGESVITYNEVPWHAATNFLRASTGASAEGACWRYDTLSERLAQANGRLDGPAALALLDKVSQPNTQWSVVYGLASGEVDVVMGREYDSPHSFRLGPGTE